MYLLLALFSIGFVCCMADLFSGGFLAHRIYTDYDSYKDMHVQLFEISILLIGLLMVAVGVIFS